MTILFCSSKRETGSCEWKHCNAPATRTVNKRRYCEPHAVRVERILTAVFKPKT